MISYQNYKSPVGEFIIASYQNELVLCDWKYRRMRQSIDQKIQNELGADFKEKSSDIIELCIQQLEEYFNGNRTFFSIPLRFIGTEFQKGVWQELVKIPFGETISYSELSLKMNQPKAIRAIASANGANGISIIVPCHRVIGSKGELTGYAGGLNVKKRLLKLENSLQQFELFD